VAARKLVPLPPDPLPDKLCAAIDGTGIPVTAKETAGRQGKGEDGRARTREVKLAVFFTQSALDKKGYPVRDRGSESYVATFEPAGTFGNLVRAEGIRRGAGHVRQFTVLGDGAAWTWNIATAKFPEATQIVDLFHAREHVHDLSRKLEFMLGDRKEEWVAARLEDLDYGDIDGIVRATRKYPLEGVKKDEIGTALGYFENNAPRMRYHWFRQCRLFVGSGLVEAGCKSVIGHRLKRAGMHWIVNGADAITALRCQQASRPEDRIWPPRRNQTRAPAAAYSSRPCSCRWAAMRRRGRTATWPRGLHRGRDAGGFPASRRRGLRFRGTGRLPVRGPECVAEAVPPGAGRPEVAPQLGVGPVLQGDQVVGVHRGRQPVGRAVQLRLERAERAVPHDQDAAVVAVQVERVRSVVHPVVGRGVEDEIDWPGQLPDQLGVHEELVDQIDAVGDVKSPGWHAEQRQREPEQEVEPGVPLLPQRGAEVHVLRGVVGLVGSPA
jgi:hypothetical protein